MVLAKILSFIRVYPIENNVSFHTYSPLVNEIVAETMNYSKPNYLEMTFSKYLKGPDENLKKRK